jgi:hypothetical protein
MLAQVGAPAAAMRAHEEMFAYWASRRDAGRLPGRAHIHPGDFKRHLPTVSLIDVIRLDDGARRYRLRLAGTGLYGVYGGEITGKALEEVYAPAAADYWRGELDKVVEGRRPAVGMHSMSWRGSPHLSILWLRLPLASDGREVDMILGYDAPIGAGGGQALTGIRAA